MTDTNAQGGGEWSAPGTGDFASPSSAPPAAHHYRPTVAPPAPALTFRSWQPGIVALRPLPFGDFLVVPFRAMRFNRAVIVGAPVLLAVASALLTALALWLAVNDGRLDLQNVAGGPTGVTAPTVIIGIVAVLSWFATDLLASSIVVPAIARAMLGERITIKEALATVRPRIGALVVIYLMILGLLVVTTAAITALMVYLVSLDDSGVLSSLASVVGQILFLPLAGVLGVYLPVIRGAVILEGAGPMKSIRRAIALVPGRFWWTILILVVVRAVLGVVEQVVFGVMFIGGLIVILTPDSPAVLLIVIALIIAVLLVVICVLEYSLAGSVNALVYIDMRMRKEGLAFDMARAAEARHSARRHVIG